MFEIVVGIFIITNTCLQLGWFTWSYTLNRRKHEDDMTQEMETLQAEFNALELEKRQIQAEAEKSWEAFLAKMENYPKPIPSPEEVDPNEHLTKTNGKYNHNEVSGGLDGFFNATK